MKMWIRHVNFNGIITLVNMDHVNEIWAHDLRIVIAQGDNRIEAHFKSKEERDVALEEMWNHLRDK